MATFLSSVVLAAALSQAPGGAPAATGPDAIAAAQARLAQDSGDGRAWLALGRAYLTAFDEAQARRARSDSGAPRAALDGAEQALARAAALLGPAGASAEGDSARVLRVAGWSGRGRLARGAGAPPRRVREHGVRAAAPAPRRDAVGAPAARVGRGTRAGGPRAVRGLRVRRAEARARRPRSLGASGARGLRPGRPPDADVVRDAGDVWTVR